MFTDSMVDDQRHPNYLSQMGNAVGSIIPVDHTDYRLHESFIILENRPDIPAYVYHSRWVKRLKERE